LPINGALLFRRAKTAGVSSCGLPQARVGSRAAPPAVGKGVSMEAALEGLESYGVVSLLPVACVIITAVITRRAVEALLVGTLVGSIIIAGTGFWGQWFDFTLTEIGDSAYYVVMFGMFGALIRLLDDSGAALGFADVGAKVSNTRKKTMIFTWILGIIIFIEDYLNALGVGVAMRSLTDKWKISREFLAYLVNSTGAAVCILVPISTWGVLYSSQIEDLGIIEGMRGMEAYARSIPFMLYAWVAVLIVPFFCLGILPLFGQMKKAEARALETGKTFPDWYYEGGAADELNTEVKPSSAWNFIVPMVVMVIVTLISDFDITLAVIVSYVVCFLMLFLQRKVTLGDFLDKLVLGFKDMLYVTMLVLIAFMLQDVNDTLGLTPFVISTVAPVLSPVVFPMITFLVVAVLAFCTGSFWGVAMISFPIILPLALAMDVNPFLAIGAVSAATSFGSHACFYSDAVTVTAAATGIRNMDYAKTSIPLIMVPFGIAIVLYLLVGFIMA
jgi:Na+/H+ antiporter NhaC